MPRTARGRRAELNFWPGFVDALSTLLLVMIFVISIFVIAQFYLGRAISTKDDELARLTAQILELTEQLGLAEATNTDLNKQLAALAATLADTEDKLTASESSVVALTAALAAAEAQTGAVAADLAKERELTQEQADQLAILNQQIAALRQQLASLQEALDAAEAKDKEQEAQIANLSQRLNQALAQKVQELNRVRSRFFEALLEALGDRSDVKVVGDRFIFESDILFGSCSDEIGAEGRAELKKLADVLIDISGDIPSDLNWVLRVDGHADAQPLGPGCRAKFQSNWHLSAARAIAVVQYLDQAGVPSRRMVAAGFGRYQPLVQGSSTTALSQNRRIEFKLTER
ncbi:MAG: peptidoglycan -binding protein [Pseudomonadota bacterium]